MVRGLLFRQTFLIVDLFLFVLILLFGCMVVMQFLPHRNQVLAESRLGGPGSAEGAVFALRGRDAYDSITNSGLFGEAGRLEGPPESPGSPPPLETGLSLRLLGTTSLSPRSLFCSASIEDARNRDGSKLFLVGATVVPNVTLEEVHPRWVLLRNGQRDPAVLERLTMDGAELEGTPLTGGVGANVVRMKRIVLDKQAFVRELYRDYPGLTTKVKPSLYTDQNGQILGVTAKNIASIAVAKHLGLEDGDILQQVNHEKIDSEAKILKLVQKYQHADSFQVQILRNGRTHDIAYQFE